VTPDSGLGRCSAGTVLSQKSDDSASKRPLSVTRACARGCLANTHIGASSPVPPKFGGDALLCLGLTTRSPQVRDPHARESETQPQRGSRSLPNRAAAPLRLTRHEGTAPTGRRGGSRRGTKQGGFLVLFQLRCRLQGCAAKPMARWGTRASGGGGPLSSMVRASLGSKEGMHQPRHCTCMFLQDPHEGTHGDRRWPILTNVTVARRGRWETARAGQRSGVRRPAVALWGRSAPCAGGPSTRTAAPTQRTAPV